MKVSTEVKRNAVAEYDLTPEKVKELVKQYEGLEVLPNDKPSYQIVHKAKMVLVKTRTAIDRRRKELGDDARKWVNEVNSAAKALLEPMALVEDHLKSELKKEDERIEAIRQEKIAKEMARVANIRGKIEGIENLALEGKSHQGSKVIKTWIDKLSAIEITEDIYMEFTDLAKLAKDDSLSSLQEDYENRLAWEKEQEEAKIEAERLEKIRFEQEAERKKLEAVQKAQEEAARKIQEAEDAAQRKIAEERAKLEAEKQAEQERKDRAAFEEKAVEEAKRAAEEEARRKEQERAKKEAEEAAEKARREAMAPDREKLLNLANRISDLRGDDIDLGKEAHSIQDETFSRLMTVERWLRKSIEKM
jgi:hypothetical protein